MSFFFSWVISFTIHVPYYKYSKILKGISHTNILRDRFLYLSNNGFLFFHRGICEAFGRTFETTVHTLWFATYFTEALSHDSFPRKSCSTICTKGNPRGLWRCILNRLHGQQSHHTGLLSEGPCRSLEMSQMYSKDNIRK